jgi:hypothetical protein
VFCLRVPSDPGPDVVSDEPPFGSLQFTVLEVLNALLDLDSNKGPGSEVVLWRLHCHFVCSSTGHWCLAFFLFFKSGKRNDVSNYRGIPILSTVGKLFELLVYRHMYKDLKSQLADCQHGFLKGISTVSNLLEYSSFLLKSMGVRWIQSTRTFVRPLIRSVIVCSWIKPRLMLSHPTVSGWVLTFLVESSA